MDTVQYTEELQRFEGEVQRHLRWNLVVHLLDGALFWFGINFAAAGTIVPLYVRHLTSNPLLIGLVATIAGSGWYLPQLLTVNYVQRLPRKKPFVIRAGLFSERLPLLGMALSAFLFAARSPRLALILFFVSLTWFNVGAGIIAVAWQDMFAKVIPVQYRGRLLGLANFVGTATGVLGASFAASILERYSFPINFGLCFALAFLFILLSWVSLALTREPPLRRSRETTSFREYWLRLPQVIQADRNFLYYLAARVITMLARLGMGFLAVYAVERWRLSDSQAGLFTIAIVVGQAAANLSLGPLADRKGHKLVLEISLALTALSMVGALVAPSPVWMYAVFAIVGASSAADILSMIGIVIEFTGPDDRPTYVGLANTIPGLFGAFSPIIGGWLAGHTSYGATFATGATLSLVAWVVLHRMVRDPRGAAAR